MGGERGSENREGVVVGAKCMWSGKMCRVYEGESVIPSRAGSEDGRAWREQGSEKASERGITSGGA